jgi:hypothetical protein
MAIDPLDEGGAHGEVFTRRWVVDLILDLADYTSERDVAGLVAVEPSCGSGAFLVPMIERLSESLRRHDRRLPEAADAIRAFDLLPRNVELATGAVVATLETEGWRPAEARRVAAAWITGGDYLLSQHEDESADFVIGNPPYIRLEDLPDDRLAAYRATCSAMGGRADIYIGFFEVGLATLCPGGTLAFICADRWMRNQYGNRLRSLLAERYDVTTTIEMHAVDAFEEQVSAYPAITVIRNRPQEPAVIATTNGSFGPSDATSLLTWWRGSRRRPQRTRTFQVGQLPHWFRGDGSWPTGSPARLALLEELNDRFEPLEDRSTETRIGIGVATGSDEVFVVDQPPDIEEDRLLPLAISRDTRSGRLRWSNHYLVNPWLPSGRLVDLTRYPRLAAYFEANAAALHKRNVAKRLPASWFRTIDKVDHALTAKAKLLFPDMKMETHPVLDPGGLYPHHNLYFVVSDRWDLKVLGGLLLSKVTEFFIDCYAVKMRNRTLRFQAQYLRRIRVPRPDQIPPRLASDLSVAFDGRDSQSATAAAFEVYGITDIPE